MKNVAVLISNSGTGSNLQALIDAISTKKLLVNISLVLSDSEDAKGLILAKKYHIPTRIFNYKTEKLEDIFDDSVDFVILTGWKKIIPDAFIKKFDKKVINIHPGLIPSSLTGFVRNPDGTKGLWNRGKFMDKAIEEFFNKKATYAGSTVHFLSQEFDFGEVLDRCFERIKKNDTVESLYEKLKEKEHAMLIRVLRKRTKQ